MERGAEDFWDEDSVIKDSLFNTNLSMKDIASEVGLTEYKLAKRIKELGLTWVRRKDRKMSRGHAALFHILQRLAPNETVVTEYHIGERLMLDIYCPALKLAIEFHGRQHFYYVEHFHGDKQGFTDSQKRDERKEEMCREQDITLVVFRYNDNLDEDIVFERLVDAIRSSKPPAEPEPTKSRYKGNPYYEAQKQRQREWRKEQYKKMKSQRQKRE
jgi:hypothetical protein